MPELTHNIVYKITNLVNGKIYVGVHKTNNLEDGYMGSGTVLRKSLKKYGLENFNKEVLFDFSTYKEALEKEKEIVDEDFLSRKDTYNLRRGGLGGFDYIRLQPQFYEWHRKAVSIGTKNAAISNHKNAVDKYYQNPKLCEFCNKIIPYEKKQNRFCNSSCSAKRQCRRKLKYIIKVYDMDFVKDNYDKNPKRCLYCNSKIPFSKRRQIYCSKSCKSLKQHKDNPQLRFSNPRGINKTI